MNRCMFFSLVRTNGIGIEVSPTEPNEGYSDNFSIIMIRVAARDGGMVKELVIELMIDK